MWLPVILSAVILLLYMVFSKYVDCSQATGFGMVMTELPLIWLIIVKVTALFTSGVHLSGDRIAVKYSKGYSFHTVSVSRRKLAVVTVIQSPFQRIFGKSTVKFRIVGKEKTWHTVKALKYADSEIIIDMLK